MLFWPSERSEESDITEVVKAFYEETPFPDYDDFDSVASLAKKARQGIFARMLDQQLPPGIRIVECGCGTGQLSNFLSIANRTVFATDMCVNSLRLGQSFAREHQIEGVHFMQMNLLRPFFRPESFDLVICNGVLMTLPEPFAGFETISKLVRPGGYVLIGLYHRYGRLITDARRVVFRITGDRFLSLDPVLRSAEVSSAKKRAWLVDQYKHPCETKHTIGEAIRWLKETGFSFVKSVPRTKLFRPISDADHLFEAEPPGNAFERLLVELGMAFRGSREGGFFTVVGRRT
jgi:SAM-dependent methyltransferase